MADKAKVIPGRLAVDAYRTAHISLYSKGWYKGISEAHTPLLEQLLIDLQKAGYASLAAFFADSEEFNVNELGFEKVKDFHKEIDRLTKIPDKAKIKELCDKLQEKWH